MDRQNYRDLQDWDKGSHRERKGIRAGLDPSTDRPQRNLTYTRTPVEKEDLSRPNAGATEPQGQHQAPRRPLTFPGPLLNGRRPGLESEGVGAAAAQAEDMDPTDVVKSKEEEGGGSLEAHVEDDKSPGTHANMGNVVYNNNYNYFYKYKDTGDGAVEGPTEGTPEDTQDPDQHPTPSAQAQAQDRLYDAARQSKGRILQAHGEDKHSPLKKTINPQGTRISLDCGKGYNTIKKLNRHFKKAHLALRGCTEEQRAQQQAEGNGEQNASRRPATPTAWLRRRVARRYHCRGPWQWLWSGAWNIMTTLS